MLKGANLKGGRRPSAPYWPAATVREYVVGRVLLCSILSGFQHIAWCLLQCVVDGVFWVVARPLLL